MKNTGKDFSIEEAGKSKYCVPIRYVIAKFNVELPDVEDGAVYVTDANADDRRSIVVVSYILVLGFPTVLMAAFIQLGQI